MRQLLMLIVLMASSLWAQQVPKEVQKMIDGYKKDPGIEHVGLISAQRFLGVDTSLKIADIQVGQPIEVYNIKENLLDTCSSDMPLRSLLVPANIWTFAVQAHWKYLYHVDIVKGKDSKWFWGGAGELKENNWWQKLRKTYPESSGINPILIQDNAYQYLYFPQKSTHNYFFIKNGNEQFPFALASSNSMDSLDDSRGLVPHLKQQWKETKPLRDAYNKKHPGTFETKSDDGGVK